MEGGLTHSLHHSKSDLSAGRSVFPFIPLPQQKPYSSAIVTVCFVLQWRCRISEASRYQMDHCALLSSPSYSPATQRILTVARDGGSFWYGQFFDAASDRAVYNSRRTVMQQIANKRMGVFYCEKCAKWEWICVISKQIWNFVKRIDCWQEKSAKMRPMTI